MAGVGFVSLDDFLLGRLDFGFDTLEFCYYIWLLYRLNFCLASFNFFQFAGLIFFNLNSNIRHTVPKLASPWTSISAQKQGGEREYSQTRWNGELWIEADYEVKESELDKERLAVTLKIANNSKLLNWKRGTPKNRFSRFGTEREGERETDLAWLPCA